MSRRTLRFVERRSQAGEPEPDTDVVVLDPWWTPGADAPGEAIALRPVIERVLAASNLVDGSLDRLDAWASAAGIADRFVVDGVTWWFKVRMEVRWDLHELMIWQQVLAELAPPGRYDRIEVPWRRAALGQAAKAVARASRRSGATRPRVVLRHGRDELPDLYQRARRSAGRRWRIRWAIGAVRDLDPRVRARRDRVDARIERLASARPTVLGIAWAGAFHVLRDDDRDRRMDPHISLVLDRLAARGTPVALVTEGLDHQAAGDWAAIAADERVLPQSIVDERGWRARERAGSGMPGQTRGRAGRTLPLVVDGTDLGPAMDGVVRRYAGRWLDAQVRATGWVEQALGDIRPGVVFLDREGTRTKWIVAARRLGIPVVAIQHGMIYPGNPEYCHPAHPAALRADVSCVFGPAERDLLLREGGYAPDAVVVTGSPRADIAAAREPIAPDERDAVRRELGVADGDRLLVVSVAHNAIEGDLYGSAMVAATLGGPLPGVHVVVKLHPQDRRHPDYPRLLRGLAAAGGYRPPPVTMVRDIDIHRLLRSADAHLGQYSTVLTDAVVTDTPNMIAVGQARADPLAYVGAGVAVPVTSVGDVRSFMADPRRPRSEDREAFLRRHFEPGDATERIAEVLCALAG